MRAATKSDGSSYWEYVLLYVDDALCISENAERVLRDEVGKYFELKEKLRSKYFVHILDKEGNKIELWEPILDNKK